MWMNGWMDGWGALSSVDICHFLFVPPPNDFIFAFTNLVVIDLVDLEGNCYLHGLLQWR